MTMGSGRFAGRRCDRARQWISLQLDGELSEFERALLDAHLESCAECRAFEGDVSTITGQLRAAPPESLTQPVVLPSRRHGLLRPLRVGAAAAAVVAVAGVATLIGSFRSESTLPSSLAQSRAGTDFGMDSGLRALRRDLLKPAPLLQRNLQTREPRLGA